MKRITILLILCIPAAMVFSQNHIELTLDKAISMALENNYAYLISLEGIKQYKHRLRQNLGFLPQISLEGTKNLDEKLMEIEMPPILPGTDPSKVTLDFTKNYEFSLQIVQPIFTGGKIIHNFKNAKLDLKIAKEKKREVKDEVILNVKKVFYNLLVTKKLLAAHQEALKLAQNNYDNVHERLKLGMVSKYDLLRADLNVSTIKPRILKVKKQIQVSTINLKMLLGIPDEVDIKLAGQLTYNRKDLLLSHLIKQSLVNRSEVLQMKMEKQKINNLLKIVYAQFIPDFSIIASYSYRADLFKFTENNWDNYYTINLGIHFPIFTGLKRSAQVGEMKVMKKILDLNSKQLYDNTRMLVQNLYLTLKEEYENIQTGLKNMETSEEGVRIADLNYREGLISILELNASYNSLTMAKVAYLQAVYNTVIALAELEKITGLKIRGGES